MENNRSEKKKLYYLKNKDKIDSKRKEYYLKNRERILNQVKQAHYDNPEKKLIYMKKYYKENKDKLLKKVKKYYLENIKGKPIKKKYLESNRKWGEENPEKIKAHRMVRYKVKIPKYQDRQICSSNFANHKHHFNYSQPLKVNFLCHSCHKIVHLKL